MDITRKKKQVRLCFFLIIIVMFLCICVLLLYQVESESENNIEHRLQWWRTEIGAEDKLSANMGSGVKIAIIDTGVDRTHPDLKNAMIKEISIKNSNGEAADEAHGTAVAGIMVAFPSDEAGVLGLSPMAELVSIDVTDSEYVTPEEIVAGIEIAIREDVDIISISLGLKNDNDAVHDAIKSAYEKGIVIVASAGNYMEGDVLYPAKYDEVLCVGALDKKGEIISPKEIQDKKVIYLPGENIVTTYSGERQYVGATGTSFSTAILSGIIALMMELKPDITLQEIYTYFEELPHDSKVTISGCLNMD